MARKKVKLTYIVNDTMRKITFKKRKVGVVKKLDEITTLCGIEACTVIYSAFDSQPLVWPSIDEAKRLITKFKSFSKVDQVKRNVNQESFTRQMLEKMEEKLKKQKRENHHKEMTQIMFQFMMDSQETLLMLNREDYKELSRVINQNLTEVERMMEMRQRDSSSFIRPPIGGDMSGGSDSKHLVLSHHEFKPPNHGRFQSSRPGGSGGGGQQFVLSHPNHERFQSPSLDISISPNMTYPPPRMAFLPPNMTNPSPANIEFSPLSTVFPGNDNAYMNHNMGISYQSNQPDLPYYHNADIGPHDPSLH
ncbi:agamous-like MADS-box protein AGL80 [Impatiens glandulifera]|uniref:agamous-like MADS-box protein AGL80 n=1 Tax=Impatiens glandulifera TaxID=253017 RepID=UPI001FB18A1D|nr:agamous-like MADS-box protein AGL80 [Impatiens glandulifera]